MGSKARYDAAKLRLKFSRVFKISLEDIDVREYPDDTIVWAPKHPDFPEWSLGYND